MFRTELGRLIITQKHFSKTVLFCRIWFCLQFQSNLLLHKLLTIEKI